VKEIEKAGFSVEIIKLRELKFFPCDGCAECDSNERCHIEDEMQAVYPKIFAARAWIIASPEYWWNVSGLCKNFLDRLNAYWKNRKKFFGGKKAAVLTVGGQPLERTGFAEKYLELFFEKMYCEVIGKVRASAENPKEVLKQSGVMNECRALGKKIAEQLSAETERKKID
jgi:multimeric flavodoxin WrbA